MSKIKKRPQNSLFFADETLQNISGSNWDASKPQGEKGEVLEMMGVNVCFPFCNAVHFCNCPFITMATINAHWRPHFRVNKLNESILSCCFCPTFIRMWDGHLSPGRNSRPPPPGKRGGSYGLMHQTAEFCVEEAAKWKRRSDVWQLGH